MAEQEELLQYLLESNEAILVMLMRLYDVQMTQLMATAPEQAKALEAAHEAGKVIGSMPYLNIEGDKDE